MRGTRRMLVVRVWFRAAHENAERDEALLGQSDELGEFPGVVAHRARSMHYSEMSVQLESPRQTRRRFPSSDESSDQAVSRLEAANHTKPSPAEN